MEDRRWQVGYEIQKPFWAKRKELGISLIDVAREVKNATGLSGMRDYVRLISWGQWTASRGGVLTTQDHLYRLGHTLYAVGFWTGDKLIESLYKSIPGAFGEEFVYPPQDAPKAKYQHTHLEGEGAGYGGRNRMAHRDHLTPLS